MLRTETTRKLGRALCLIVLAWLLAGCGGEPPGGWLASLERDYFDSLFRSHPTFASAEGFHQYDGRLDDYSPIALDRRTAELGQMLLRLRALDGKKMSERERIDARLIEAAIRRELLLWGPSGIARSSPLVYLEFPVRAIERTARRNYAPASTRLDAVIVSLSDFEAVLAALRTNVTGISPIQAEVAAERLDRVIRFLDVDLRAWGRSAAGIDARLARNFEGSLAMTLRSVRRTGSWLREELAPRSSGDFALGPRRLIMSVLFDSLAEIPLSGLRSLAARELERDSGALLEQARRMGPGKPARVVLQEAAAGHPAPEELRGALLGQAREVEDFAIGRGLAALPEGGDLPQPELLVDERWESLRRPLLAFGVDLPPMDGGAKRDSIGGYLVFSPPPASWPSVERDRQWRAFRSANAQLAAAALLVPGRYLQSLYAMRRPTRAQRLLQSRVTREGWGLYAEQMMVEEGFGEGDPAVRLLQLERAVVRDCRFVTSLGLHTGRMSAEQARRLFEEKALLSAPAAALEVRRTEVDPMRLAPALGRALILQLREDYRRKRGAAFRSAEFQNKFLSFGGMPIPLIREALMKE